MIRFVFATLAFASLLGLPAVADAQIICDLDKSCPAGSYDALYPNDDDECDDSKTIVNRCHSDSSPPTSAVLNCESLGGGGFICEAWPQGPMTFGWTTTGGLYFPYPSEPDNPMRGVSCQGQSGGTVTVTVTAPNGQAATASRHLTCTGN